MPSREININLTIVLGFVLRTCVSIWSGFWGPSFGADQDAFGFHTEAVAYSRDAVLDEFTVGHIYSYALGVVYYVFTDSMFLGCMVSTIVWLCSAYVLLQTMRLLSMDPSNQLNAMRVFSLLQAASCRSTCATSSIAIWRVAIFRGVSYASTATRAAIRSSWAFRASAEASAPRVRRGG